MRFVAVRGGWGITAEGLAVEPVNGGILAKPYWASFEINRTEHPSIARSNFIASQSLSIGDWLAGLWKQADQRNLIAAFRCQSSAAPTPLIESDVPIVGFFYLPAPDSAGGVFTILQELGPSHYRWVWAEWSEAPLRNIEAVAKRICKA